MGGATFYHMPVTNVIDVDDHRLEVFINADGNAAIVLGDASNRMDGSVIVLEKSDLLEFIKMCRKVYSQMDNG
jgi:hypothetical protein